MLGEKERTGVRIGSDFISYCSNPSLTLKIEAETKPLLNDQYKILSVWQTFPIFEAAVNEWNKTIKGRVLLCKKIQFWPRYEEGRTGGQFLLCLDVSVKLI